MDIRLKNSSINIAVASQIFTEELQILTNKRKHIRALAHFQSNTTDTELVYDYFTIDHPLLNGTDQG